MQYPKHMLTLTILLLVLAAVSVAQTWDATKDFGPSNPNGAWSYGWGVTGTSFTLYPFYYPDCGDFYGVHGIICWTADIAPDHNPHVSFNTTGEWLNYATVVNPPNALLLHPAPDWDPGDSIVQWKTPATANYRISGFFEILDTNPTGIIGLVFRNSTLLYKVELLGPPAQHPDKIGGRANFYFPELSLNVGDVISFGVNSDGNWNNDSTGFNATIVTPPTAPPCSVCSEQRRSP
jgi:hypothetical protein